MRKLKKGRLGALRAKPLDETKLDARAPVAGKTRGLVDDEEVAVFKENRKLLFGHGRRRRLFKRLLRHTHRRQTHHVAFGNARVDVHALFVDAHLARTHDAVDVALGDALQNPQQEVVKALPVACGIDGHVVHARGIKRRTRLQVQRRFKRRGRGGLGTVLGHGKRSGWQKSKGRCNAA